MLPTGDAAFTRSGVFHLDQDGRIVTAPGNPLTPSITIPANALSVTVGTDGTVSVTLPAQTQAQQVGAMQLAIFANPGGVGNDRQTIVLVAWTS